MSDLAEFLLARIAEDEETARAATPGPWRRIVNNDTYIGGNFSDDGEDYLDVADIRKFTDVDHIARWDPARVLAECEAKRALVTELARMLDEEVGWDNIEYKVMGYLALPYADHPDYREEWRP